MATYLFGYCITQFLAFFVRANIVVYYMMVSSMGCLLTPNGRFGRSSA